jgi:hypothetical protein
MLGEDGSLFEASTGTRIAKTGGKGAVYSVQISQGGRTVATQSTDSSLAIWDTRNIVKDSLADSLVRSEVCSLNHDPIGNFNRDDVQLDSEPGSSVKDFVIDRPWNPCDWRGLGSAEGLGPPYQARFKIRGRRPSPFPCDPGDSRTVPQVGPDGI